MKKFIVGLLLAGIIGLFCACGGGGGKTPEGITKELCGYLQKGDYKKHFEKQYEYLTDAEKAKMSEEQQQMFVTTLTQVFEEEMGKRGGYKSIDVKEDKSDSEDTAYVLATYHFNNDQTDSEWFTFLKTAQGWRIKSRGNR